MIRILNDKLQSHLIKEQGQRFGKNGKGGS